MAKLSTELKKIFLSKKLLFSLLIVFANLPLLIAGVISESVWETVVISVIGLYMAGNVGEHGANAYRDRSRTQQTITVENQEETDCIE